MISILKEKFPVIFRVFIVGFILLLSSLMAYKSPQLIQGNSRLTMLVLLAFVGFIGILVFLKTPPLGLIVLIIADLAIPFSLGTGTQTSLSVPILLIPFLTGVGLLDWFMKRQPTHLFILGQRGRYSCSS